MKNAISLASNVATILAVALWLGGMIALGAIVAPVVFSIVPAPTSADAMTVVFRRFDALALGCAATVLACELWRVKNTRALVRLDVARGVAAAIAGVLALVEGLVVAPHVEELHRAGAVRGLGDLGAQLETAHALAERVSKCEAIFVVVFVILYVSTIGRAQNPH